VEQVTPEQEATHPGYCRCGRPFIYTPTQLGERGFMYFSCEALDRGHEYVALFYGSIRGLIEATMFNTDENFQT
jgi:hypothetical protein